MIVCFFVMIAWLYLLYHYHYHPTTNINHKEINVDTNQPARAGTVCFAQMEGRRGLLQPNKAGWEDRPHHRSQHRDWKRDCGRPGKQRWGILPLLVLTSVLHAPTYYKLHSLQMSCASVTGILVLVVELGLPLGLRSLVQKFFFIFIDFTYSQT